MRFEVDSLTERKVDAVLHTFPVSEIVSTSQQGQSSTEKEWRPTLPMRYQREDPEEMKLTGRRNSIAVEFVYV